ncbi:MAG: hypothetical protein ACRCY0_01100 [Synechococcus elongatus]|uniref:hypothetical protein n=1 Tax=Synechococcus elongatus TaxID=32046 RepID=UPI003F2DD3F3
MPPSLGDRQTVALIVPFSDSPVPRTAVRSDSLWAADDSEKETRSGWAQPKSLAGTQQSGSQVKLLFA